MTTTPDSDGTPDGLTSTWESRQRLGAPTAPEGFPEMIEALRDLQDKVTAAAPPDELIAELTKTFTDLADRLAPHAVDERRQITGHLTELPGRGQTMSPALHVDEADAQHAVGRVYFGRFYLGGNGAVHGGAIPLLFDEVMGRLANTGGRRPSRTAYLRVNYRSIAPIETELRVEARFDREEGRKRFLVAELYDGDTLCADAEGLFVQLRPGQP
ncbi:PaaI family thioesterase [Streptomyces sp. NPDC059262]|uniref:PaaI family thioesterase n=1 Tax=Streptomyces sp. NPDC059262 TaxID=3346797 RepID=UPI00367C345E